MTKTDGMDVGDLINYSWAGLLRPAVVVRHREDAVVTGIVFLGVEDGRFMARTGAYALNRLWWTAKTDHPEITDPTDEQLTTAMHIMLTGYVPGVDDE